jgi:hypothetical protein
MVPAAGADESVETELRLHPLLFLMVAIAAGAAFVGVCQTAFPIFHFPEELLVYEPPPEIVAAQRVASSRVHVLNATVALGILGLLMAALLGAGEAAARRFERRALIGLVVGTVLGTAVGCLSGLLGQALMEQLRFVRALAPITQTTLAQICTLGMFGLGVGAAVGAARGSRRRLLTFVGAGAVSGVLAGLLFPVACAFVLYGVETEGVTIPGGVLGGRSETWGLVLWMGLLVAAVGLIVPLVTREKPSTSPADEQAEE